MSDAELEEENVRAVRHGGGANCSSIGSVVDTLFLGAAFGGAIVAAVLAAMKTEDVRVIAPKDEKNEQDDEP